MNKWFCEAPDCKSVAVGVGTAFGLRAIGWFFEYGGPCYCPFHRPDPVLCHDEISVREDPERAARPCSLCRAEDCAAELQRRLVR